MLIGLAKPQVVFHSLTVEKTLMSDDEIEDDSDELVFELQTEIPIPSLFYSEETRRPFERCIDCNAELLLPIGPDNDESVFYQVHKVIARNEAVFEFAMCADCQKCLQSEFSAETIQAITEYQRERLSINLFSHRGSFEECVDACLACRRSRSELYRYSLSGVFAGASLLLMPGPYIFCGECELEMAELVSEKTRDAWDRFIDEHFDAPPGVEADEWDRTPMLI